MAKRRKDAGQAAEDRPVVKRERAEIYSVIGQLERAKERRQKLVKRLDAHRAIEEAIRLADAEIKDLTERATGMMTAGPGPAVSGEA